MPLVRVIEIEVDDYNYDCEPKISQQDITNWEEITETQLSLLRKAISAKNTTFSNDGWTGTKQIIVKLEPIETTRETISSLINNSKELIKKQEEARKKREEVAEKTRLKKLATKEERKRKQLEKLKLELGEN